MSAREFQRAWLTHALLSEAASKEGREKLKLRVSGRRAGQMEEAGLIRGAAGSPARAPDAPAQVLLDGERAAASIFTDTQRMLALLPPDDPRAKYLRNGGALDEQGNPLIYHLDADSPLRKRAFAAPDPETAAAERLAAGRQPYAADAPLDPVVSSSASSASSSASSASSSSFNATPASVSPPSPTRTLDDALLGDSALPSLNL